MTREIPSDTYGGTLYTMLHSIDAAADRDGHCRNTPTAFCSIGMADWFWIDVGQRIGHRARCTTRLAERTLIDQCYLWGYVPLHLLSSR
jgi:hypothetical protein